jgi:hypothetical protein
MSADPLHRAIAATANTKTREPIGYALYEPPYFVGAWTDIEIARMLAAKNKRRDYKILPIYDELMT